MINPPTDHYIVGLTQPQLHKLDMLVSKAMMRQPLLDDHWPNLTHEHYMEYVELEHISWIIRQLARTQREQG